MTNVIYNDDDIIRKEYTPNCKKISFIIPSRNNLPYLKNAYNSIRQNSNAYHQICVADDFSNDSTEQWCKETSKIDRAFNYIRNNGPERLGHTILYDRLINRVAVYDIVMIFHADMYVAKDFDINILKYLERGIVVSGTRVEPPLHPRGPEKLIEDFGIQVEEFDTKGFIEYARQQVNDNECKTTTGIFAPWAIYKKDFQAIGGHDPLFRPQSKEDSDIFNRFKLAGYKLIQSWSALVYHLTCRGSRFKNKDDIQRNASGKVFIKGRESQEWLKQNVKSTKNFIRKWGTRVMHDKYMDPIIAPKYNIKYNVIHCNENLLSLLEPMCDIIVVDYDIHDYLITEQPNTDYDLYKKIYYSCDINKSPDADIVVEIDGNKFTENDFEVLIKLPFILKDSGEVGIMEYGNLSFTINKLERKEKDLIYVKK